MNPFIFMCTVYVLGLLVMHCMISRILCTTLQGLRHEVFHETVDSTGNIEAIEKTVGFLNDQYDRREEISKKLIAASALTTKESGVSLEIL